MMRTYKFQITTLGAVVCMLAMAASTVVAQAPGGPRGQRGPGGRGPGGFGRGGAGMMGLLLGSPAVQEEIKLTEDQKTKLEDLRSEFRPQRGQGGGQRGAQGGQRGNRGARGAEFAKRREEMEKKVKGILNEEQVTRVQQIARQLAGPAAIMQDKKLAKELDVTEDQKAAMRKVMEGQREAMRDLFAAVQDGAVSRQEMRGKFEELRKETEKKALGVLSSEQKEKYTALLGKPFDRSQLGFGGRGRGGPGGQGPRGRGRRGPGGGQRGGPRGNRPPSGN